MEAKNLSNEQLYQLLRNESLDWEIRNVANSELTARKLSITELDNLALKFEKPNVESLTPIEKLTLVFLPLDFVQRFYINKRLLREERIGWHANLSSVSIASEMFKRKGQLKLSKQYWNYYLLGIAFYTIVCVVVGMIFFRNK